MLKIKELRKKKKLSQSELANKIDISVRMFAEYENETADIPLKKLQRIADILQVDFLDLFDLPKPYSEETGENSSILNEPIELYGQKNKALQILEDYNLHLKKQVLELQDDKDFLKSVINNKLGKETA